MSIRHDFFLAYNANNYRSYVYNWIFEFLLRGEGWGEHTWDIGMGWERGSFKGYSVMYKRGIPSNFAVRGRTWYCTLRSCFNFSSAVCAASLGVSGRGVEAGGRRGVFVVWGGGRGVCSVWGEGQLDLIVG